MEYSVCIFLTTWHGGMICMRSLLCREPPGSGGGGHLRRNTWSRSSLRRTPHSNGQSDVSCVVVAKCLESRGETFSCFSPASGDHNLSRRWGSFRQSSKRVTGSNVPTSPLYRSASFNSSGRSSNCGDADDMYCSDASLEEDVLGLNRKVPNRNL
ncbi:hypothetical protein B566_EDAN010969 [Ephemera danica]|nr:hypothetical protein B566_EDAN010969 [Ephemera danica]